VHALLARDAGERSKDDRSGAWLLANGTVAAPAPRHRNIPIEVAA